MEQYKKWLEEQIEKCLNDRDLQREHWAYCTAYRKLIEALPIHGVVRGGVFEMASFHGDKDLSKHTDRQFTANTPTEPLPAEGSATVAARWNYCKRDTLFKDSDCVVQCDECHEHEVWKSSEGQP